MTDLIGNMPGIPGSAISNSEAIITLDIEQEQVRQGNVFTCNNFVQSVPASGVVDLVFDPTAFTGQRIRLVTPVITVTGGPVEWETFAGITANDDGTVCQSFNRNFNSIKTPETIIRLNPTGIITPTPAKARKVIPGATTGAAIANSASAAFTLPIGINKSVKYLLRLTNKDTAALAYLEYLISWFEVPA